MHLLPTDLANKNFYFRKVTSIELKVLNAWKKWRKRETFLVNSAQVLGEPVSNDDRLVDIWSIRRIGELWESEETDGRVGNAFGS